VPLLRCTPEPWSLPCRTPRSGRSSATTANSMMFQHRSWKASRPGVQPLPHPCLHERTQATLWMMRRAGACTLPDHCSTEYDAEYFKKNPCVTTLDTTPLLSEHEVNTDRVRERSLSPAVEREREREQYQRGAGASCQYSAHWPLGPNNRSSARSSDGAALVNVEACLRRTRSRLC